MLGHERELWQRLSRASVIEQKQSQTVASSEVQGIRCGDALEDPARFFRVAFPLPVQRRNREVDLQVEPIGMRGCEAGEDLAGAVVVELTHQADAAIVQADQVVGDLFLATGTRTGDRDDQPHGGEELAGPTCQGTRSDGAQGRPV